MPQLLEVTEYDVIILGTGFIESILAGALARIGKSVLHLDANNFYGGNWSSLNFKELLEWTRSIQGVDESSANENSQERIEGKKALMTNFTKIRQQAYSTIEYEFYPIHEQVDDVPAILLKESKRYNLDLAPKMVPCRGELIELLISSGVGRYLEFKAMDKTYIYSADTFDKVPCSKEDVFTNQSISLIEKRKLMRFLTFALDYTNSPDTYKDYEEKSFTTLLIEKFKIDGKLLLAVLYTITLIRTDANDINTIQGLEKTQSYLKSLGRYGNAAFLVGLYGCGNEIAQGFCRICAVYGGIYMLDHSVKHLLIDENSNKFTGLVDVNDQQISSTFLVSSIDYLPPIFLKEDEHWETTSRAIVIIDKFIHEESGDASLTVYPPETVKNKYPVTVLQFSAGTQTCPEDRYIVSDTKPNPLFALFYRHKKRVVSSSEIPENIIIASDPDSSLDFEEATIQARQYFEKMCPGEEFLPAGPDPDDEDEFIV
ncbi:13327_t:CDS:10 [Gigaspora margarita]|uniref:13327_t:CDS:1 n=1 Tax=Gigaspora margarita TaxID=4874 RepID=A0ABN7VAV7_GIGMA|nr:13327_t:CDS:10 [Gigaspora margarita]